MDVHNHGLLLSPFSNSTKILYRIHCSLQTKVKGPPKNYTLKDAAYKESLEIVASQFPQLCDLVENGSLVVHKRRSDYKERREDGYKEPALIFILGTCHLSAKSASDVERLIQIVHPENVVVELCKSRIAAMYDPPETSQDITPFLLSGSNVAETMIRTIRLGGLLSMTFRVLMGNMTKRIGHSFDVQSGIEMRAARKAADDIDAQIILGDRPIEITLKRAIESLSLVQRLDLFSRLLMGLFTPQSVIVTRAEEIRTKMDALDEDVISQWTRQLTDAFPTLASPLIHERDLYLAWSMKRSKAVNGSKNVVGVVGRGHLKGTYYALQNDKGDLRFKDLIGQRSKESWLPSLSKRFILEIVFACACYVAWNAFHQNLINVSL